MADNIIRVYPGGQSTIAGNVTADATIDARITAKLLANTTPVTTLPFADKSSSIATTEYVKKINRITLTSANPRLVIQAQDSYIDHAGNAHIYCLLAVTAGAPADMSTILTGAPAALYDTNPYFSVIDPYSSIASQGTSHQMASISGAAINGRGTALPDQYIVVKGRYSVA